MVKVGGKENLRVILRTFLYVVKILSFGLTYPVLFTVVRAAVPIINIILTKKLIDSITISIENPSLIVSSISFLLIQMVLSFSLIFLNKIEAIIRIKNEAKLQYATDKQLLMKCVKLPLIFYDDPQSYNITRRAFAIGNKHIKLVDFILTVSQHTITFIGYAIIMYSIHWMLCILSLISIIPFMLITTSMGRMQYRFEIQQSDNDRKQSYLKQLVNSRETIKEIKVFGHAKYIMDLWSVFYWNHVKDWLKLNKSKGRAEIGLDLVKSVFQFIFFGTLIWIIIQRNLSIGDYVSLSQTALSSIMMVQTISRQLSGVYTDSAYMQDFFSFLEQEEDCSESKRYDNVNNKSSIQINNLSFCYPHSLKESITDISFTINKGEHIAIVGENGSGKSTLVKCIMGLYKPTRGEVLIEGIASDNKVLKNKISIIFQDFTKYNLTLRENIAIANLDEFDNDDKIIDALTKAGAVNVLTEQMTLDTELGLLFQGGKELSGGQWQKIAIARALFKDTDIIILDEPTAALDPISEAQILERFFEISRNKTTITITHRLASCRNADRIIVMKDGRVVEQGTHQELMILDAYYAHMYRSQSKWYHSSEMPAI